MIFLLSFLLSLFVVFVDASSSKVKSFETVRDYIILSNDIDPINRNNEEELKNQNNKIDDIYDAPPSNISCHLCKNKNSLVGSSKRVVDTINNWELTCKEMEKIAIMPEWTESECNSIQKLAEYCSCVRNDRILVNELEEDQKQQQILDTIYQQIEEIETEQLPAEISRYEEKREDFLSNMIYDYDEKKVEDKDEHILKEKVSMKENNDNDGIIEILARAPAEQSEENKIVTVFANLFLFIFVGGIMTEVSVKQLKAQLRNKAALFTGTAIQFIILPFVGFLTILLLKNILNNSDDENLHNQKFTRAMGEAFIICSSLPGGSISNLYVSCFNADLELSVAMTFVSSLLSFIVLPMNFLFYSYLIYGLFDDDSNIVEYHNDYKENLQNEMEKGFKGEVNLFSPESLMIPLIVVIVAIFTGIFFSLKLKNKVIKQNTAKIASVIGGVGVVVVSFYVLFFGSVEEMEARTIFSHDWQFYVAILANILFALFLSQYSALTFTNVTKPECVALNLECSQKNCKIGMSLALSMFSHTGEKKQALVMVWAFTATSVCVNFFYCLCVWKLGWTNAPPDDNFFKVIFSSYESSSSENNKEKENKKKSTMIDDNSIHTIGDEDLATKMKKELEMWDPDEISGRNKTCSMH